jgi:hypothetical protein
VGGAPDELAPSSSDEVRRSRYRRRQDDQATEVTTVVDGDPDIAVWRWQATDEAGVARDEPSLRFTSQALAEQWLAEHFEDLADDGVAAVTLFDGERAVYGPMPLAEG